MKTTIENETVVVGDFSGNMRDEDKEIDRVRESKGDKVCDFDSVSVRELRVAVHERVPKNDGVPVAD